MDPIVAGSLISAGSSLLGGLFGSKSKNKYVVPDYAKIRAKAEAAGFNPLTALGAAPGSVVSSSSQYMGQAIADAGMLLADGLAKSSQSGQLSQLQQANAKLKDQVQSLTLRPKVGGIYAQREAVPTMAAALGVSNDRNSRGVLEPPASAGQNPDRSSGDRNIERLNPNPIAGDREVDRAKLSNSGGVIEIDNSLTGGPVTIPGDGGEPWGIDELATAAIVGGPQAFWNHGEKLSYGGSFGTHDYVRMRGYRKQGQDYLAKRDADRAEAEASRKRSDALVKRNGLTMRRRMPFEARQRGYYQ